MKKTLLFVAMMLCCAMTMFAQNDKISYQAVVRDTANRLVANKSVEVTVNIYNGTATTAAYTETQTVTTNLNGLISLQIGPNGTNANWNSIEWNQARIETTVKLNGTQLGTLAMPLTAVPYAMYAKYADNVDPAAIAAQMHDTANNVRNEVNTQVNNLETEINNLSNSVDNGMNALSNRIAADSTNLVNFKAKENADSLALGTLIDAKANTIDLAQVAFTGSYTNLTDKPTIGNATLTIKQGTNTLGTFTANASDAATITVPAQVQSNWAEEDNTAVSFIQNKPAIPATVAELSDADDYATKTYLSQQLTNTLNTLNARIDSVINVMNNLPTRMVEQRDTVQTAGQTSFTLAHEARADCVVRMYINGVMVGGNYNDVVTVSNTTVTYDPAQNGNYALKADDKVTIVYWY